jgi:hypothetical protein
MSRKFTLALATGSALVASAMLVTSAAADQYPPRTCGYSRTGLCAGLPNAPFGFTNTGPNWGPKCPTCNPSVSSHLIPNKPPSGR